MNGRGAFIQEETDLERSSHPVLWLRVMFLVSRAKDLNLINEADELERQWNLIAQTLGVSADYYGYYSDQYYPDIIQMIDDMLPETSPISFQDYDQNISKINIEQHNFVQQIDCAWNLYERDILGYPKWESAIISNVLGSDPH